MPSTASFWTIINNVYDEASAALRMNLSYDHTHSSGSGSGGQLDWDVIWSDAVHSHGTDAEGGVLDHGQAMSSASLADDDHPQYVQESVFTTAGDVAYASGSATWTRLAAGSADYILTSSGIGTAVSWAASPAAGLAFYGDGNDGSVTISGNTTLTRDMYYDNLTINSTIELTTAGYRVFVKDTLTNNGFIQWNGNNGSNGGNGSASTGGSLGSGGAALTSTSLPGGEDGKAGVGGGNGITDGVGQGGGNGVAGDSVSKCVNTANGVLSGTGGAGGAGGANGGGGGGASGAVGTATVTTRPPRYIPAAIQYLEQIGTTFALYTTNAGCASGGAGGGGGGASPSDTGGGGGGSGGSGSGGGTVLVAAKTINNTNGVIRANGGTGGNGGNGGNATGDTSGGGGGGAGAAGGNGGVLVLIYNSLTSGTQQATGGAAGTGGTGGLKQGGGVAGSAGANGTAGNAGVVITLTNA